MFCIPGCNSAPSPTSSDHTPSKRPKLLAQSSVKNGLHDVTNYAAAPSSIPVFKDDRRFSLHSCPNLADRKKSSPFDVFQPAMPNFCCPQVCHSVDTSAKAGFMPSLSGIENVATHPPHFVVPKCFKVTPDFIHVMIYKLDEAFFFSRQLHGLVKANGASLVMCHSGLVVNGFAHYTKDYSLAY